MMISASRRIASLLPIWVALLAVAASGQDSPKPGDDAKDGKGRWVPVFLRHANDYVITADQGEEAKRLPDPLLRWWQPIRGGDDGAAPTSG